MKLVFLLTCCAVPAVLLRGKGGARWFDCMQSIPGLLSESAFSRLEQAQGLQWEHVAGHCWEAVLGEGGENK